MCACECVSVCCVCESVYVCIVGGRARVCFVCVWILYGRQVECVGKLGEDIYCIITRGIVLWQ